MRQLGPPTPSAVKVDDIDSSVTSAPAVGAVIGSLVSNWRQATLLEGALGYRRLHLDGGTPCKPTPGHGHPHCRHSWETGGAVAYLALAQRPAALPLEQPAAFQPCPLAMARGLQKKPPYSARIRHPAG